MIRTILTSASLTGVFCAAFTLVMSYVTNMLALGQVMALSFASGFLGSVFAQTVLARWKERRK